MMMKERARAAVSALPTCDGSATRKLWRVAAAVLALSTACATWAHAKPMPTHICSPRLGNYNDRQAFIGFDDGTVQWCQAGGACVKLEGMPVGKAGVAAMSCEREQFVWVILSNGAVYRCAAALGRTSCERIHLQ
jgi:hypothetical protein